MKNKIIHPNKYEYFDRIPNSMFEKPEDEIYQSDCHTLADIVKFVNDKGFQDYSKIKIGSACHSRSNDTYIWIEVSIPKTEQEILAEQEEVIRKENEQIAAKVERKRKKQEKIDAKAAALLKLSAEERKLLGY